MSAFMGRLGVIGEYLARKLSQVEVLHGFGQGAALHTRQGQQLAHYLGGSKRLLLQHAQGDLALGWRIGFAQVTRE